MRGCWQGLAADSFRAQPDVAQAHLTLCQTSSLADLPAAPSRCAPAILRNGPMAQRRSNWSNESSTKRGYGYAWQQLRLQILERDCYLCQCDECKRTGALKPAGEVDHIKRKADGGTDDPANLRSVNHDCHERITLEQKGTTPKPQVGLDGWPIEM